MHTPKIVQIYSVIDQDRATGDADEMLFALSPYTVLDIHVRVSLNLGMIQDHLAMNMRTM